MKTKKKPTAKLLGANGNIFNLLGIASSSLRSAKMNQEASEMTKKVMSSRSYEEALGIIMEYVDVK